jgi:hypothetical protein
MTSELTTRRTFAVTQIIVGLLTPLLFEKSMFNFSRSGSFGAIGYWYILPVACFLLISFLALSRNNEKFRVSRSGLWGATTGAYLAFVLPAYLLFIASATYTGGGVDIGLALLAVGAPVLVPILLSIGLIVGEFLAYLRAPNSAFKRDSPRSGRAP